MNPKEGTACKAEKPVEPAEPEEATAAEPGEKAEGTGGGGGEGSGGGGSKESSEEEKEEETTWVEIQLKDKKGNPVPGKNYEVKLADGSIRAGKLDKDGKARIAGVQPGKCDVKFTNVDKNEWKKA